MCFIVKYVLFIANVIFALAGLTLIGVGSAVLVLASDAIAVIPVGLIDAIPISVIVLGSIVFVVSFFGCCGAIRENRCFLASYAIIMLLLAAGKMYLAVVIFLAMNNIRENVAEWLTKAFQNDARDPFHAVETAFQCCGTTGFQSYIGVVTALPPSCCDLSAEVCDATNAFEGCNGVVGEFFATYGTATASILVVIIWVELIAVIFGFSLCNNVTNKRRETA